MFATKPRVRPRPLVVTNQAQYRASYRQLYGALAQCRTRPPLKARAFLHIAPTIAAFAPSALETLCRSAAATADPIRRLHLPRQEAFHLSKPAPAEASSRRLAAVRFNGHHGPRTLTGGRPRGKHCMSASSGGFSGTRQRTGGVS